MPDTEHDLIFLVIDTARLLRVEADRRARTHGMTRAQWAILIRLERQEGLSQKELAELLEVEPITVARLLDRLESRGMLERRADPRDRRVWRLHLLPAGRAMLAEIDLHRRDMTAMLTAGLEPAHVAAIFDGLLHLKSSLSQKAPSAVLSRRSKTSTSRVISPGASPGTSPAARRKQATPTPSTPETV